MKLVADEGVDSPIVGRLRQAGHDVVYIAELAGGIDDDEVLREANDRSAILLTADKDFGELVYRQRRNHHGIVLLRLAGLPQSDKADIVAEAFDQHGDDFAGAFTVIAPGNVRIRH